MKKKSKVSRRSFLGTSAVLATGMVTPAVAAKNPGDAELFMKSQDDLLASTFESQTGKGVSTDAVHAGEHREYSLYPIYQGTTNPAYSRDSNPTIERLKKKYVSLKVLNMAWPQHVGCEFLDSYRVH